HAIRKEIRQSAAHDDPSPTPVQFLICRECQAELHESPIEEGIARLDPKRRGGPVEHLKYEWHQSASDPLMVVSSGRSTGSGLISPESLGSVAEPRAALEGRVGDCAPCPAGLAPSAQRPPNPAQPFGSERLNDMVRDDGPG